MTVAEFDEKYYLHDSSLEKVAFDADLKILRLTIAFCFWMQDWYDKSEPTNGLIRVTFKDVSRFEYDDCIADKIFADNLDGEIRSGEIGADGSLEIFSVEYSEPDDIYYLLKINSADVDVEELERYNF